MEVSEMDPAARLEVEAMKFVEPIDLATERGDSEVQQFYQDVVLFITGGTGFIGKQLLEKLFRSCDIKKAFILIRPKKGISTMDRLQEMLRDPVFGPVLKKKPDLASRMVGVEGDTTSIHLGISNNDWEKMVDEVEVIFHAAATVRFDENLRTAAYTNVRGTKEALALGRACKKLKSFVHISTAYSRATSDWAGKEIREQFYPNPVPADTLLTLVDTVSPEYLDTITRSLISGWPNNYTFTKAVAEKLVQAESGNFPVCVVRPSIVINTYREPVPGWMDASSVYGPCGIAISVVMGFLRVLFVNNTLKISFVPADYVNNATIAAGWYTGVRGLREPIIYNISSTSSGVTFSHISGPMRTKCRSIVSPASIWCCFLIETSNRLIYWILSWLLHYIPAYITDTIMKFFRIKKPKELKSFVHLYRKVDKLIGVLSYFAIHEWHFDETNLKQLWQTMSPTDRTIYNFDMSTIDWDHLTLMMIIGIRKYIVKDGLKRTNEAIVKQKWLMLANYAVGILYLYIFWMILRWLWWIFRIMF